MLYIYKNNNYSSSLSHYILIIIFIKRNPSDKLGGFLLTFSRKLIMNLTAFDDEPEEKTPDQKNKKYMSIPGFVVTPILRGFESIKNLYYLVSTVNGIIAGGYVRYCASPVLNPVEAGDVDVFFRDDESFNFVKKYLESESMKIKHENNISVTYARSTTGKFAFYPTIQLIKPTIKGAIVTKGTLNEILSNFDFTVIRAGIMNEKEALVDADFAHDEEHRYLRLKNIHCPISSTLRCLKYAKKGYFLSVTETLRLFYDWDSRDQEYRNKLLQGLKDLESDKELTQEEIDELEELLRID